MAAAQDERLAVEDTAFGMTREVPHHSITTACIVCIMQSVVAHRDELALVAGGSARLGIELHTSGPQDITLAMTHTVDKAFELLIRTHRRIGGKLTVTHALRIAVRMSPFRI